MKKRILALALAGTTAFSVFGSALSANAYDSTHEISEDGDYYVSYEPAGNLSWDVTVSGTNYVEINNGFYYAGSDTTYGNLGTNDAGQTIVDANKVFMPPWRTNEGYDGLRTEINDYNTKKVSNYQYFEDYEELADDLGYEAMTVVDDAFGQVGGTGNDADYIIAKSTTSNTYHAFTKEAWEKWYGTEGKGNKAAYDNSGVTAGMIFFMPDSSEASADGVSGARVYQPNDLRTECANKYGWYLVGNGATYTDPELAFTNMHYEPGVTPGSAVVYTGNAETHDSLWKDNGAAVTKLNKVYETVADVMEEPVKTDGTVYMYDYELSLPADIDAEDFIEAWEDGTVAQLLHQETGSAYGTIEPYFGTRDIREDVMDEWEDFLDDLGIADPNMEGDELTLWAEDTYSNYLYTYWDANVVTRVVNYADGTWEITIESGKNVDVYNFHELIEDILELAPANNPDMDHTQTSELVYLMQQYEKYTDGFVDPVPVDTDDWGDLLVALAEAPTQDEFSTANRYKAYMNAAEDYIEEYQEADTNAAVKLAEQRLYNFVTDKAADYKVSEKADKTTLATAIDSLFFNYDWRYDYKATPTGSTTLVERDAEVYAGAIESDGKMGINMVEDDYLASYALYPVADYAGSVMTGNYPGVDTPIHSVTSEYFWFYNVYDLAYNVYVGNTHQSTLDLMAETLNEAAAALTPDANSTAHASDVLGAEEAYGKLADLIDTDYDASIWDNRTKIATYISDRVMNDEIGEVGTNNSEEIANRTARLMGRQKYQTSVTRSEINSLKTSRTNAQNALTDLRKDEDNYNAAQANALEKAIEECDYIIAIYDGDYALSGKTQTINETYDGRVGDKDQILKSDITDAMDAVEAAINFSNIIQGWSQDKDDNWMYGTEEGYLNDGWHQVDGGKTWFYFNEDGTAKQSEWWQDPATGTWYWFNSNCGAAVGWAKIDGDWYYFKGNNAMKTGWEKVEGSWYYMNSSGKMVTGWCQINGTWYYFSKESNALGQMLANTTTPDGYKVDANGALVE